MDGGEMTAVRDCVVTLLFLSAGASMRLSAQDSARVAEAQTVLAALVETYGVSGAEGPVREAVKRLLPTWAVSSTDTAGNLWGRVGQGNPVGGIVAHLDGIGFPGTGVRDDGTPGVENRGGVFPCLLPAQPALADTGKGDVAG